MGIAERSKFAAGYREEGMAVVQQVPVLGVRGAPDRVVLDTDGSTLHVLEYLKQPDHSRDIMQAEGKKQDGRF